MKKIISFNLILGLITLINSCGNKNVDVKKDALLTTDLIDIDSISDNRYCYIKEVLKSNDNLFIKVDYVDYLTGKKATEAEWRDKAYFIDGTDTISNITDGYYISNINPKIRVFKIGFDAKTENIIDDNGVNKIDEIKPLNEVQLNKYIEMNSLVFLHIKKGIVKSIDEQFMP